MKVEIVNQQKIKKLNLKAVKLILKKIFTAIFAKKKLVAALLTSSKRRSLRHLSAKKISFVFCDNNFIRSLNKKFFKKNRPTDVIAFPLGDKFEPGYLGEVVISVEEAVKRAALWKNSLKEELSLYLIHGILHLLGCGDQSKKQRAAMAKIENEVMEKIFSGK